MYLGCEQRRGKDGSPFVTLHLATPDGPVDYSVKNQYFEQERVRIKEIPKGEIVVVELKKSHSKKSGKTWASPGAFYPFTNCAIARERILSFGRRKKLIRRSSSA